MTPIYTDALIINVLPKQKLQNPPRTPAAVAIAPTWNKDVADTSKLHLNFACTARNGHSEAGTAIYPEAWGRITNLSYGGDQR